MPALLQVATRALGKDAKGVSWMDATRWHRRPRSVPLRGKASAGCSGKESVAHHGASRPGRAANPGAATWPSVRRLSAILCIRWRDIVSPRTWQNARMHARECRDTVTVTSDDRQAGQSPRHAAKCVQPHKRAAVAVRRRSQVTVTLRPIRPSSDNSFPPDADLDRRRCMIDD